MASADDSGMSEIVSDAAAARVNICTSSLRRNPLTVSRNPSQVRCKIDQSHTLPRHFIDAATSFIRGKLGDMFRYRIEPVVVSDCGQERVHCENSGNPRYIVHAIGINLMHPM